MAQSTSDLHTIGRSSTRSRRLPSCMLLTLLCVAATSAMAPSVALADEEVRLRESWDGSVNYFMTGASLAIDTDGNNRPDVLSLPTDIGVRGSDVPASASLLNAYVYWAGTQTQVNNDCNGSVADDQITLTVPKGTPTTITADLCYCSDGDNDFYDMWVCKKDITSLINDAGGRMTGDYTIDDYEGRIENGSTDNAGAAVIIVYESPEQRPRRVSLYDGNLTMSRSTKVIRLSGVRVDTLPVGNFTYFTLEGDIGGSENERVHVNGSPGQNGPITVVDVINPIDNPMNRTINTTTPVQTNDGGIDIDQFDISTALSPNDSAVEVEYVADGDKWWLIVNIIGIDTFDPYLQEESFKSAEITDDVDGDGQADVGDTVRFTIHLENTGNEAGTITLTDIIPAPYESWTLVSHDSGTDQSNDSRLELSNVQIAPGASVDIVIDVVVGDAPDQSKMLNSASWSKPPQGGSAGTVEAPPIEVRRDIDGDTIHDNDDNCPFHANTDQKDSDGNGFGDACDGCADADGDGFTNIACGGDDCNDSDPNTYPGAEELCDGLDNSCDGFVAKDEISFTYDVLKCVYSFAPDVDADGDGLDNKTELALGTDPGSIDTDDDGLTDPEEIGDGEEPLDTDFDGVPDYTDTDDDDDGVPTKREVSDSGDDDDVDGDGLKNWHDIDADGDNVVDGTEAGDNKNSPVDSDGDRIPDYLDDDSDNDGVKDDVDNCRIVENPGQEDTDQNGVGDECADEICDNRSDDNDDGKVDCEDPLCETAKICREICNNDEDDDDDGDVDCNDTDCAGNSACPELCDNGIDDNGDGRGDCADPQCADDPACMFEDVEGNGMELLDDPTDGSKEDCNCAVKRPSKSEGPLGWFVLGLVPALVLLRRRRRSRTGS